LLLFWPLLGALTLSAAQADDSAAELKAASALHDQADYVKSIPRLRKIVARSPRSYLANLLLGEDLLSSGDAHASLAPLRAATAVRPDDGTAPAYLAEAAITLGDLATASEALQTAVTHSGGADQFVLAWANFCIDRFRALEAQMRATKRGEGSEMRIAAWTRPAGSETTESLLEQSAAADPEQRGIWGELGVAQLEMGRLAPAQASLAEAMNRDPHGPETLQLQALLAAVEQNWQAAAEHLSTLGKRSPAQLGRVLAEWPPTLMPPPEVSGTVWDCLRNTTVACPLVAAKPQGGEHLSARELYEQGRWEQLRDLPPATGADRSQSVWRGVAQARTSDCPQAIPTLERGFEADKWVASFWLQICYAGEIGHAEERLNSAGNEAALHELKGDVALRLRYDAAQAQKEYAEALKSRPSDPPLLAREAEAYKVLGDTANARSAALAALAANPRQASALQTLAQMAMDERDYAEALDRLKQLAAVQPKDAWTQVELGVAYGQLGQPSEALHHLGPQLAAGYPDPKGALHAQLAAALRKLGRDQEAKQAAAEAAKLANASLQNSGQSNASGNPNSPE
jgi:tetratricopeptide (TPR) repeat protein